MDISVETRATRITVKCAGRLDVASARTFEETVGALVRESRRPIVLDFSRLQYISSAGIRSLLFLMKTAASCSLSGPSRTLLPLRLAQAGPAVRQVLELSGLLDNFSTGVRPAADRPAASGRTGGELLPLLRDAFPSPVSDADADARFVASIAEGLGRIDELRRKNSVRAAARTPAPARPAPAPPGRAPPLRNRH